MPYIVKKNRKRAAGVPKDRGELNFCITSMVCASLIKDGLRYSNINDVIGALDKARDVATDQIRYLANEGRLGTASLPMTKLAADITEVCVNYASVTLAEADPKISKDLLVAGLTEQVRGALRCVELELYDRVVRGYEDVKKVENGDVYPAALIKHAKPKRGFIKRRAKPRAKTAKKAA